MRNSRGFWGGLFDIQGLKTKLYTNCLKMSCVSTYEHSCIWQRVLAFSDTVSVLFVLQQRDSKYRACLYLSLAQWRAAIDRRRSRWGLTELLGRELIEGDWGGLWRHSNASNDGEINESFKCTTFIKKIKELFANFHVLLVQMILFFWLQPQKIIIIQTASLIFS